MHNTSPLNGVLEKITPNKIIPDANYYLKQALKEAPDIFGFNIESGVASRETAQAVVQHHTFD